MQTSAHWLIASHGLVRMASLRQRWIRRSCPPRTPRWATRPAAEDVIAAPTAKSAMDVIHAGRWAWASPPPWSWPSAWPGRCDHYPTPRRRIAPKPIQRWLARQWKPNSPLKLPRAWLPRSSPIRLRHCLPSHCLPKQAWPKPIQSEPVRPKTQPWLRTKTLPPIANRPCQPCLPKRGSVCRSSKQARWRTSTNHNPPCPHRFRHHLPRRLLRPARRSRNPFSQHRCRPPRSSTHPRQ